MEAGRPDHLITQALFPHLEAFNLDINLLLAIIDGMEMDLDKVRYESFDDLKKYCWHVASAVGILAAPDIRTDKPANRRIRRKARAGIPADEYYPGRWRRYQNRPYLPACR